MLPVRAARPLWPHGLGLRGPGSDEQDARWTMAFTALFRGRQLRLTVCLPVGNQPSLSCTVWVAIDMNEAVFRIVGKPLPRNEDARLVAGRGRFTDDFRLEGQVYAAMVRSPHPHARILGIDAARAKAMPGVLGVFTGAD